MNVDANLIRPRHFFGFLIPGILCAGGAGHIGTLTTYEAAIERHITPNLGRIRLTKLTAQHLQAWLRQLETAGVSANRRRYARVILRMALNTAMRWRLVTGPHCIKMMGWWPSLRATVAKRPTTNRALA